MNNDTVGKPDKYFNDTELDNVDEESQLTEFGYIRNSQEILFNIISKNISLIILAFVYEEFSDEFDPELCGDDVQLSNNNKRISNIYSYTCYGKQFISSINNGMYVWKIKIISDQYSYTFIGIDNSFAIYANQQYVDFSNSYVKAMYAYDLYGTLYCYDSKQITSLPRIRNKGDILTIKLDLNQKRGVLTLKVNNDEEVVAINNVTRDEGLNYRLAIYSKKRECCYEIIN